jgi:PKHD-type hydroxylase
MNYSTCYTLDDARKRDYGDFYWFAEGFNPDELNKLEYQIDKSEISLDYGTIFASDKLETVDEYRRSKIGWVPQDSEFDWVYEKIAGMTREANDKLWHFELTGMAEQAQYTVYDGREEGHYDWHLDLGAEGCAARRKVTVVIQLSDPEKYEGGDLKIKIKRDDVSVWKKQGGVCVFPSFFVHKVEPVTKGTRKSLILWNSGPPFK